MQISGHKTRAVFDRYNIVSERDIHEAGQKMERYMREVEKHHEGANKGQTSSITDKPILH